MIARCLFSARLVVLLFGVVVLCDCFVLIVLYIVLVVSLLLGFVLLSSIRCLVYGV